MSVLENQTALEELKTRLRNTWMTGDYGRFCRYMERDAEAFYRRLSIKPGAQLLDVGCGAGQLTLIAARAGARVTGCDIATNWLARHVEARPRRGLQSCSKKPMRKHCLTETPASMRWSA